MMCGLMILLFFVLAAAKNDHDPIEKRLFGGTEPEADLYPFQVSLYIQSEDRQISHCSGTLIKPRAVLTAAHCLYGPASQWGKRKAVRFQPDWYLTTRYMLATSALVILGANADSTRRFDIGGSHNLSNTYGENTEEKNTTSPLKLWSHDFVINPYYDVLTHRNDIAIIKLPPEADAMIAFSNNIGFIDLQPMSEKIKFTNQSVTVCGWGMSEDSGNSNKLTCATDKIITNEECAKTFKFITRSQICFSNEGGTSACAGDSGGPMIFTINGTKTLIGISSHGHNYYCSKETPSVYIRIIYYLDWIESETKSGISNRDLTNDWLLFLILIVFSISH